jgi:hypothetical protein
MSKSLDELFLICSHADMSRINPEVFAVHIELALVSAPVETLAALCSVDRKRRNTATASLAAHVAARLGCFDVRFECDAMPVAQAGLFPDDLSPMRV